MYIHARNAAVSLFVSFIFGICSVGHIDGEGLLNSPASYKGKMPKLSTVEACLWIYSAFCCVGGPAECEKLGKLKRAD